MWCPVVLYYGNCCLHFQGTYPKDLGSRFIRKVDNILPDYTVPILKLDVASSSKTLVTFCHLQIIVNRLRLLWVLPVTLQNFPWTLVREFVFTYWTTRNASSCVDAIFTTREHLAPPLWSSSQSSWLQIQRSRVRFPALPDFVRSSGSGTRVHSASWV
jgi:hypothetical protein